MTTNRTLETIWIGKQPIEIRTDIEENVHGIIFPVYSASVEFNGHIIFYKSMISPIDALNGLTAIINLATAIKANKGYTVTDESDVTIKLSGNDRMDKLKDSIENLAKEKFPEVKND